MSILSILSISFVMLSCMIALLPSIISHKRVLYYWRTIFALQFLGGLIGTIDIINTTINGTSTSTVFYFIVLQCIFVSFNMSHIIRCKVKCKPCERCES